MTADYDPQIPPAPALSADARNWGMLAHLSALVAFAGVPSFVGPLVVWLVKREQDGYVGDHAREALNFNLSVLLYLVAAFALVLVTFGIGLLVVLPVALVGFAYWLIVTVIAAVRASNGEGYRYPLTIRFVS